MSASLHWNNIYAATGTLNQWKLFAWMYDWSNADPSVMLTYVNFDMTKLSNKTYFRFQLFSLGLLNSAIFLTVA